MKNIEIDDLIYRLEKSTGPDREIDDAIHEMMPKPKVVVPLKYTRSIDDALTVIPAGYRWRLGYSRNVPHVAELVDYGQHAVGSFCGECDSNRAIAICIAALKARTFATNSTAVRNA